MMQRKLLVYFRGLGNYPAYSMSAGWSGETLVANSAYLAATAGENGAFSFWTTYLLYFDLGMVACTPRHFIDCRIVRVM